MEGEQKGVQEGGVVHVVPGPAQAKGHGGKSGWEEAAEAEEVGLVPHLVPASMFRPPFP